MAFKLAELFTDISVRGMGKYNQQMNTAKATTSKTGSSLAGIGTAALAAGAAVTGIVYAFGRFSASALQASASAEEIASQFGTVFKDQTAEAQKFAEVLASKTNRSVYDLKQFMAGFQDTFVPLGYARDEARKLSESITALTIDLSSLTILLQLRIFFDHHGIPVHANELTIFNAERIVFQCGPDQPHSITDICNSSIHNNKRYRVHIIATVFALVLKLLIAVYLESNIRNIS